MSKLRNVYSVGGGFYVVRTQAGFKHQLKLIANHHDIDWRQTDYLRVTHPVSYPALVSYHIAYEGVCYIDCNVVHINEVMECLREQGEIE